MVEKICHLADLQIRKTPTRNSEYEKVFQNLIKSLKEKKPDRIVIVGDLVNDYLDLQGEQLIMVCKLLNDLGEIAPVRITRGNHDCRNKNLNRVDSIKAIVDTLHNPNVVYYDETNIFYDENIAWAVWHYGDKNNNPWKTKEGKVYEKLRNTSTDKDENGNWTIPQYTAIDLYHETVYGSKMPSGLENKSKSYNKLSDFKGDFSFFGHIHKLQYLDKEKTKAYSGSLIAQDITEGDDEFHGYLLWNIADKTVEEISIHNDYSFKNIKINSYTDFDDLDFEVNNPTKHMKIRFVWGTLPQTRTAGNERKLMEYVKSKHPNTVFSHKNEFLENEKIQVNENITLQNITEKSVQHEIFKEYLEKIGTDENVIKDVIALDEEILNEIDIIDDIGVEWEIIKFGGKNFMSYGELDIDWREMDGLFQITGKNTHGKTTIFKILSYILFGKTLETETRKKFGDSRFVNDRNGATYCEGYLVISANGEYYGIKKRTQITKSKDGIIDGAPTSLSYYLLSTPDDEMNDNTSLDKLDEDRRIKTQKKIDSIIGSYDNFMRIVMTTSDTLNRILSNDMAVFIDSLLFDSGLDVFDKKLEGWKIINKRNNEKPRVSCNIDFKTAENATLTQEIRVLESEISEIETIKLPDVRNKIQTGRTYIESLTKKLFKIDPEIYNLDVDNTKNDISGHQKNINDHNARKSILDKNIILLKESYDEKRLNFLIEKRDEHKNEEYTQKLKIKTIEQLIRDEEHLIEIINGDVFRLKQEGAKLKKEIGETKNSKICSQCGQEINKPEHIKHIDEVVKAKEIDMFKIANQIKTKEETDKPNHIILIQEKKSEIVLLEESISTASLEMENILIEIGTLTNDKNDVEKRKGFQTELNQIPILVQNEQLKIDILQQKINNHEKSLKQIETNHKIEKGIDASKEKIILIENEESDLKEDVYIKKTLVGEKQSKIKANGVLISDFKVQEYNDMIMNLYKKCVHRDGIPRQMLSSYIIPKINLTLERILSVAPFKVWLDVDDLRPKLAYHKRLNSIIDCISASGKERTFSSVPLKFALNYINVKAKPAIFLLDEVMGKLDDDSVEEFIEMLQLIKKEMKKVLIVEHRINIEADYNIEVEVDENDISSLKII